MPIADDIKQFYPDDWESVRERVLERAADREETEHGHPMPAPHDGPQCEWCGKPNEMYLRVYDDGLWDFPARVGYGLDEWWEDFDEHHHGESYFLRFTSTGKRRGGYFPVVGGDPPGGRDITVVLTIAHLDHDPRESDLDRLRALCQRCHLGYDNQPQQRAKRERIYAELRGQQTLLEAGCE